MEGDDELLFQLALLIVHIEKRHVHFEILYQRSREPWLLLVALYGRHELVDLMVSMHLPSVSHR